MVPMRVALNPPFLPFQGMDGALVVPGVLLPTHPVSAGMRPNSFTLGLSDSGSGFGSQLGACLLQYLCPARCSVATSAAWPSVITTSCANFLVSIESMSPVMDHTFMKARAPDVASPAVFYASAHPKLCLLHSL